jgi:hypothetical protein
MAAYTSSDLVSAVKRRAFAPTGQNTFPAADILALADEEMETLIVPELMAVREEYFLTFTDYTVTAGQAAYPIPDRAIGMGVREIKLVGASGGFEDLPQIVPESLSSDTTGTPSAFYMRENSIVLWPTPVSTTSTLRVFYCRQQSKLIETSAAAVLSSVVGLTANVNAVPSGWSTSDTFDVIKATGGQEILTQDRAITSVGATSLDFAVALPTTAVAGSYIAKANETPIVQLPKEYRTVLAQAVTVRILKSMRLDGHEDEAKVLGAMMESARRVITPRVVGEPQKILSVWS